MQTYKQLIDTIVLEAQQLDTKDTPARVLFSRADVYVTRNKQDLGTPVTADAVKAIARIIINGN